jgi:hypothetical protein
MILTQEKGRIKKETCPSATLSTTNPHVLSCALTSASAVRSLRLTDCCYSTVCILRHYPGTCLDGLRKTTKNLSQDSGSPDRDLIPDPSEYGDMLNTRPWCLVTISGTARIRTKATGSKELASAIRNTYRLNIHTKAVTQATGLWKCRWLNVTAYHTFYNLHYVD